MWGGVGWWAGVGGYDQLCCSASPKLLLGLDLGLGCDNMHNCSVEAVVRTNFRCRRHLFALQNLLIIFLIVLK